MSIQSKDILAGAGGGGTSTLPGTPGLPVTQISPGDVGAFEQAVQESPQRSATYSPDTGGQPGRTATPPPASPSVAPSATSFSVPAPATQISQGEVDAFEQAVQESPQRSATYPSDTGGQSGRTAAPPPMTPSVAPPATAASVAAPTTQIFQGEADAFEQAVREKPQESVEQAQSKERQPTGRRGDVILSSLMGQAPSLPPPVQAAEAVGCTTVAGVDDHTLQQLVDSILVSAPQEKLDGTQEVRIRVHDSVLKDTDILVKMQDGQLRVQLQTSNEYSANLLHQQSHALQQALEKHRFAETVEVRVEEKRSSGEAKDGGQGQHEQRSRGNFLWDKE